MPDVIDFLVLRQSYDEALRRNWQPSKFYCMLSDLGPVFFFFFSTFKEIHLQQLKKQ